MSLTQIFYDFFSLGSVVSDAGKALHDMYMAPPGALLLLGTQAAP